MELQNWIAGLNRPAGCNDESGDEATKVNNK